MSYSDEIKKATFDAIDQLGTLAKEWVDEKTPEDTKRLLGNNKKIPTKREWSRVESWVMNDTPYVRHVEWWVKKRIYRYNKPKWNIFHEWVGVGMFRRTKAELMEKWRSVIENLFDSLIKSMNKWTG